MLLMIVARSMSVASRLAWQETDPSKNQLEKTSDL